jgi:3-phenylpropionate/trans-cinnamate dioxygenase ferredoxin component
VRAIDPILHSSDIAAGETHRASIDGFAILLCNVDGTLYAIEDVCTHDGAPLDQGQLAGCRITCPRHGAVFDVRTGAVLALPAVCPLETFPVKIIDGVIHVDL